MAARIQRDSQLGIVSLLGGRDLFAIGRSSVGRARARRMTITSAQGQPNETAFTQAACVTGVWLRAPTQAAAPQFDA